MNSADLVLPTKAGDTELVARLEKQFGVPPEDKFSRVLVGDCVIVDPPPEVGAERWSKPDHHDPQIQAVRSLMKSWPVARNSVGRIVTQFAPIVPTTPMVDTARGSTSGHYIREDGNRLAYTTIYDALGCWEALLHELYHLRLWAMGIRLEDHDGEFLDHPLDDSELFISPIRKDKRRPMSACLHGWMAWIAICQADLNMLDYGEATSNVEDLSIRQMLKWNIPKVEEGLLTFEKHACWNEAGQPFAEKLYSWASDVIADGWYEVGLELRDEALLANRTWIETTEVPESPLHETE